VLANPQVRENVGQLYENIAKEAGNTEFEFQVTGGDRYIDADGKIRSSTTGELVGQSRTSEHLITRGARGVDLRIRGVSDAVVRRAVGGTSFFPANTVPPSRYPNEPHWHLGLPNRPEFYVRPRRRPRHRGWRAPR
jgi:hypothetical protein